VITDLLDGQYPDPECVVAFNIFEGWAWDVSAVARETAADATSNSPIRHLACRSSLSDMNSASGS
jgi:hypothetical protein